ncbi:MAG: phosphotransferase [Microlunatus sp.]
MAVDLRTDRLTFRESRIDRVRHRIVGITSVGARDPSVHAPCHLSDLRLLDDRAFQAAAATFPTTFLHGDLYGLNVLSEPSGGVLVIDWGTARVGPGMFDIAMNAPSKTSPSLLAYQAEWARIGGCHRLFDLEFDWCQILINTMFAGTVARRSSVPDALAMLDVAEAALARFHGV